jgi:hypothetical protein
LAISPQPTIANFVFVIIDTPYPRINFLSLTYIRDRRDDSPTRG